MTAFITLALFAAGAVTLVAWLDHEARIGDQMLADFEPDHDTDGCDACHTADDRTLTSFDLVLWAMEMEGAS